MEDIIILYLATTIGIIIYNIIIYITYNEDPEDPEKSGPNYKLAYFLAFLSFLSTVLIYLYLKKDSGDYDSIGLALNVRPNVPSNVPPCCYISTKRDIEYMKEHGKWPASRSWKEDAHDRLGMSGPIMPCDYHTYTANRFSGYLK